MSCDEPEFLQKLKKDGKEELDLLEYVESAESEVTKVEHVEKEFIFTIEFSGEAAGKLKIYVDAEKVYERFGECEEE
jgi:hypothetical protein